MSHEAITWARQQTTGSAARKSVLLLLADWADSEWSCFPGQETIGAVAEISVRTVRRVLEDLEADGYIKRAQRRRPDGYRTSDRYWLNPAVTMSGETPISPDIHDRSHRTSTTTSPDTVTGYPSVEPPVEPPERDASSPSDAAASPAQLSLVAEDSGPTRTEVVERRFTEHFWPAYPRRHGRRANKTQALAVWSRLSIADQRAAVKGAKLYARFCESTDTYAKDPDRWLRDRKWEEQDPTQPAASVPAVVSSAPALGLPNGGKVTMSPEAVAAMWQQVDSGLDGTEQPAGTRGPLRSPGHR